MPVVGFTEREILRGTLLTPGWYRIRIDSVGEASSKDGGSTNYPVESTIIKEADTGSEEFKGVPLDWNFNSKAITFSIGFLKAVGIDVVPNQRYELGNAVGKEVELFVNHREWQGRQVNNVPHQYRPLRENV
jgi:hypothetical protein